MNDRLVETASKIFSKPSLSEKSRGQEAWSMWIHRKDVDQISNEYQSFEFVFEIGYGDFPYHDALLYVWRHGERIECVTEKEAQDALVSIEEHSHSTEPCPRHGYEFDLCNVVCDHEDEERNRKNVDAACRQYLDSVTWDEPWAEQVRELCRRKVIALQEIVDLAVACR